MADQARLEARSMGAMGMGAIGVIALAAIALLAPPPAAARLTQTVITGPTGSGQFGRRVAFLPNGDFVVSDPSYDAGVVADVGAVYLFSGSDFSLLGRLTGETAFDQVGVEGSEPGIRVLSNGNYLVRSPNWELPAPLIANVGALTLCDGSTGCSGVGDRKARSPCRAPLEQCGHGRDTLGRNQRGMQQQLFRLVRRGLDGTHIAFQWQTGNAHEVRIVDYHG